MQPTRRGWTVVALAVVLAILAMVFARPLTLVGAALVGTWFLTHQYRFARDLERTVASLSVVQSTAQTSVHTGDVIPVTLGATREADTALTVEITAGLPVASEATKPFTVTLESTIERADRTRMVTWPVAGNHSFEGATVTATDGLFRETLTAGPAPMVTVEPPSTQRVHVGEGGNQVAASYGSHDAGQAGSGIELAELREYVPGDQGKEIDWKATARHATPYVRKYEAETDRRTLLVVDHRASLTTGPGTITKLNTLREVALVIAGNARRLNDPLGLVTVGDDGITNRLSVASPSVNYGPVKRYLLDLTPTIEANANQTDPFSGRANSNSTNGPRDSVSPSTHSETRSSTTVGSSGNGTTLARRHTGPTDVQRSLTNLEGTDDTFARTLRLFYNDRQRYQERIAEDPLYGAVHTGVTENQGRIWTVICTDDSQPAELRETVTLAQQNGNRVTVLLAPSVLYEPGGLADVEQAYDRYIEFEEFRRELSRMDNVRALEVGPADRLATVLEAGRSGGDGL